ncbi:hypothetical protein LEP1GSC047_3545 [Leptospira inadai serovar Lyme str. 10]|uniref:Uncharacterized protein n=1 Tax=Leptospira inadai serovar Lyme str. 10 TaxID=1049790 RepID=V6HCG9_9LEPT|nr:hypothetical protein LEP1GSC047_3545 [Leptospira inadai serovar Lyme str. 10]
MELIPIESIARFEEEVHTLSPHQFYDWTSISCHILPTLDPSSFTGTATVMG